MGTFGTQSSAIAGGGNTPGDSATQAYSYDGTSWTEIAELNANKELNASGGTVTSGITIGGMISSPAVTNQVETWDGSSWTEVSELNTARARAGAAPAREAVMEGGTSTSAVSGELAEGCIPDGCD